MVPIALLALASAALAPAPVAAALAQAPVPSPSPAGPSAPGPAAPSTPLRAATPGATATPAYNFIYKPVPTAETTPFPGPNPPQINEIDLSDTTLVTPGTIHVRVLTSDAVMTVTADTFGNVIPITKKDTGLFTLEGFVPQVPEYLRNRTYNVSFTATTKDGRTSVVTLPLMLK